MRQILKSQVSVPVVMPKSKFVTQGDEYEAEIFLAAFDDTKDPRILN
jgi:hypothetical protein